MQQIQEANYDAYVNEPERRGSAIKLRRKCLLCVYTVGCLLCEMIPKYLRREEYKKKNNENVVKKKMQKNAPGPDLARGPSTTSKSRL